MSNKDHYKFSSQPERNKFCEDIISAYKSYHEYSDKKDFANNIGYGHKTGFHYQLLKDMVNLLELKEAPFQTGVLHKLFKNEDALGYEEKTINILKQYIKSAHQFALDRKAFGIENEIKISEEYAQRLQKYRKFIADKYAQISLTKYTPKMFIGDVIPLSLKNDNPEVKQRLEKLELKLSEQQNENASDLEKSEQIEKEITELREITNKEHEFKSLLVEGKNFFIHAPAGSGKSTYLKWVCHSLATDQYKIKLPIIPVFIDLKFYHNTRGEKNSLKGEIMSSLSNYLSEELILNKDIRKVICLDGLDEFTDDLELLLNDIKALVELKNSQIILSGRSKPNHARFFEMESFFLGQLKKEDIFQVLNKKFPNNAKVIYDIIDENGLIKAINPLVLSLLIIISKTKRTTDEIISFLKKPGDLFHSIFIKKFIKEYEIDKKLHEPEDWKGIKQLQVELVSYLAYYMTIVSKKSIALERETITDTLAEFIKKKTRYASINVDSTIKDFVGHGILSEYNNLIQFEKKEIRLFYTALHLSESINSFQELCEFSFTQNKVSLKKVHLIMRKYSYQHNEDWASVENFLFGIVKVERVIDKSLLAQDKEPILTLALLKQIDIIIKLISQGRQVDFELDNAEKIFNFLLGILTLEDHEAIKRGSLFDLIRRLTFMPLMIKNNRRYGLGSKAIKNINLAFLREAYLADRHLIEYVGYLFLKTYGLGISIDRFIKYFKNNDGTFVKSVIAGAFIEMDGLRIKKNFSPNKQLIILRKNDQFSILEFFILDRFIGINSKSPYTYDWIKYTLNYWQHEFINFFLHKNPEPETKIAYRFIDFCDQHLRTRLDETSLTQEACNSLMGVLESLICLEPSELAKINTSQTFVNLTVDGFVKGILSISDYERFLDRMNNKLFSDVEKQIYQESIGNFLRHLHRPKDTAKCVELLGFEIPNLKYAMIYRFVLYIAKNERSEAKHEQSQNLIFSKFQELINNEYISNSIKEYLFRLFFSYRIKLSTQLKQDIFQLVSKYPKEFSLNGFNLLGIYAFREAKEFLLRHLDNPLLKFRAYYALFLLEPENHFKYADLLEKEYKILMRNLKIVLDEKTKIIYQTPFLDARDIGDENTLELIEKLEDNPFENEEIFNFYKHWRDELKWKVKVLSKTKKKP